MADSPLTKEQILDATEQVLRRFGTDKASVVDVARALNVSHGTVYRHFSSKAVLREAVAKRWLLQVSGPLIPIVSNTDLSLNNLRLWFDTLFKIKRKKVFEDPEMFEMYTALTEESVDAINHHIHELVGQLTTIVETGMVNKEFKMGNAQKIASAIFFATARFHHPVLASEWSSPTINEEFDAVWDLILSGLIAD